jgi:hypothetical protein
MARFPYQYSNINGLPRIKSRKVTVGTETVDYGFRPDWDLNAFSGLLLVYLTDLPEGTTETLPVRFIMAGNTQNVTLAGGTNATVANFPNPGVFLVFYDRIDNILQLIGQI